MKKIEPLKNTGHWTDEIIELNAKVKDLIDAVNSLIQEEPKKDPSPKQSLREWCDEFDKKLENALFDKPKERLADVIQKAFHRRGGNDMWEVEATAALNFILNHPEFPKEREYFINGTNAGDAICIGYNQALSDVKKFLEGLK